MAAPVRALPILIPRRASPVPDGAEVLGPQYMARFACIGPACEDHCCGGWSITMDRDHYVALKDAFNGDRADRERFREAVARRDDGNRKTYANLRNDAQGNCRFLDAERLCELQGRAGEDALPDVCAIYPRSFSQVGHRFEVTASLSCPEVARQCLLHDDALDLVDLAPAAITRPEFSQVVPPEPEAPYERYVDDIRAALLGVLVDARFPLRGRLFAMVLFSRAITPLLHRGIAAVDEAALAHELEALATDEARAFLAAQAVVSELPDGRAFAGVQFLLEQHQQQHRDARLTTLVGSVYDGIFAEAGITDRANVPINAIGTIYARRRAALEATHGDRLERILRNLVGNLLLKELYVAWPTPADYINQLLLRVAACRFLLTCHPRLAGGTPVDADTLDACAVEVIYLVSRRLDHSQHRTELIAGALARAQLNSPEGAAALARL